MTQVNDLVCTIINHQGKQQGVYQQGNDDEQPYTGFQNKLESSQGISESVDKIFHGFTSDVGSGQMNRICPQPALLAMFSDHVGVDSATDIELCRDAYEAGLKTGDQIVKNVIGNRFMKSTLITVRPYIQF